jgi:Holliday junction resolvase
MWREALRVELLWGGLILLLGLGIGSVFALRARRWNDSRIRSARTRRGLRGERNAEKLLARRGYTVVARQISGGYFVDVDGAAREVSLNADLLVERHGKSLIAEVKTGPHAPRFEHADTRRQLLEYQLAFGGDGILLVDPEREEVREVRFPFAGQVPARSSRAGGLALLVLGILLMLWWWQRDA